MVRMTASCALASRRRAAQVLHLLRRRGGGKALAAASLPPRDRCSGDGVGHCGDRGDWDASGDLLRLRPRSAAPPAASLPGELSASPARRGANLAHLRRGGVSGVRGAPTCAGDSGLFASVIQLLAAPVVVEAAAGDGGSNASLGNEPGTSAKAATPAAPAAGRGSGAVEAGGSAQRPVLTRARRSFASVLPLLPHESPASRRASAAPPSFRMPPVSPVCLAMIGSFSAAMLSFSV